MGKWKAKVLSLLLAALMLSSAVLPGLAATTASTIQLVKTTGTVNVTNSSGRSLTKRDNMLLYSGYHVETKAKSYAWINLDSTKLSKLDASSKVEIRKSGKKLEVLLSSGHIYFNVTSPLSSDETLNIRTSTMVTGIRGTCGWINVVDRWTTEVYVLEGTVQCNVTDPVTGQTKTAVVESGEKITAMAYPQDQDGDKCDFIQEQFEVSDINGFVLEELAQDPELCEVIYEKSGLDVQDAVESAQERLEQDQKDLQSTLDRIEEDQAGQDNDVSTDPVWGQDGGGPDDGSGSPGGDTGSDDPGNGDDDNTTGSSITLTMRQSAEDIQGYLNRYDEVILKASSDTSQNTLVIDTDMTITNGKTLTLSDGIGVQILAGKIIFVNGTMTGGNNSTLTIEDGGELIVSSSDTLRITTILNYGILINENTGKIVTDIITTFGLFASAGVIEGAVSINDGDAEITGGTITAITQNGGSAMVTAGTVTNGYVFNSFDKAALTIEGGTISAANDGGALLVKGTNGQINIIGGTIDGGSGPAIHLFGSAKIYIGEVSDGGKGSNNAVIRRDGLGPVIESEVGTGNIYYAERSGSYSYNSGFSVLTTTPDSSGYRLIDVTVNVKSALEDTAAGQALTLLEDCEETSHLNLTAGTEGNPVILDLNGHTLTVTNGFELGGALEICDSSGTDSGTLNISGDPFYVYSYLCLNSGEITAYTTSTSEVNATLAGSNGSKLFLNGGTITNSGEGYAINAKQDDVNFINTGIRAKRSGLFCDETAEWIPEGYAVTDKPDSGGYYYLTKDGNIVGSGPEGASAVSARLTVRKAVLGLLPNMAVAANSAHTFTDVSDAAWYSEAVQYVYEHGLMDGTGGNAFSPDRALSRGMLVTILYRMEGQPSTSGADFTDVPAGQWYTDAVAWASANEIVTGYGNGKYGPDDPITREQMATILYRYAKYKGYAVTGLGDAAVFQDGDKVSTYAADAINWAIGCGLLQGSGGMLSPAGSAARAQAAAILMRFCEDAAYTYPMTVISSMDVMCEPSGILFLNDGSFLVTDTYNNVIWQVKDGASTVYAGGDTVSDPYDRPLGGYNDSTLETSYFNNPWAIVPFLDGYAVSDAENNVVRLIRGKTTQTVNGSTQEDLTITDLGVIFSHPTGLACDSEGNLYVSDTFEGAVRRITPEGNISTFIDGLTEPMGLCWKDGALYIAETGANRIVKVTDGRLTVVAGSGEDDLVDGPAAQAAFASPKGIAVDDDSTLYVSDTVNGAVRRIKNGIVTTLARRDEIDLDSFIPTSPVGLAVNGDQLYVCDNFSRKVFVISLAQ